MIELMRVGFNHILNMFASIAFDNNINPPIRKLAPIHHFTLLHGKIGPVLQKHVLQMKCCIAGIRILYIFNHEKLV